MKTLCLAFLVFTCLTLVRGQDIDKELVSLADKLSVPIKERRTKKITVLDFTDLQRGESELGKYIAEELSLNFVLVKRDFAVLDRANLAKILAEHKLTAKGLINPENAKKLGQLEGVDALIIGTIIPKGQNISLAAKIITTDTGEVAGGARAEFKPDETVKGLMSRAVTTTKASEIPAIEKGAQQIGNVFLKVESLQFTKDDSQGKILATIQIKNLSKDETLGVGISGGRGTFIQAATRVYNDFGDEFVPEYPNGVTGFAVAKLTALRPGETLTGSVKYYRYWNGTPSSAPPYRLQAEIFELSPKIRTTG
jgi:TolB-like protein